MPQTRALQRAAWLKWRPGITHSTACVSRSHTRRLRRLNLEIERGRSIVKLKIERLEQQRLRLLFCIHINMTCADASWRGCI